MHSSKKQASNRKYTITFSSLGSFHHDQTLPCESSSLALSVHLAQNIPFTTGLLSGLQLVLQQTCNCKSMFKESQILMFFCQYQQDRMQLSICESHKKFAEQPQTIFKKHYDTLKKNDTKLHRYEIFFSNRISHIQLFVT